MDTTQLAGDKMEGHTVHCVAGFFPKNVMSQCNRGSKVTQSEMSHHVTGT